MTILIIASPSGVIPEIGFSKTIISGIHLSEYKIIPVSGLVNPLWRYCSHARITIRAVEIFRKMAQWIPDNSGLLTRISGMTNHGDFT